MKNLTTYFLIAIFCAVSGGAIAQTEFKMQASDFVPHDDGFFLSGVDFDFNDDGIIDHAEGCPTADFDTEDYERRDPGNVTYELHRESGEQHGFTYYNVMILPVCDPKYAPDSASGYVPPKGFLQLRPGLDSSDIFYAHSYIASPPVKNIQSVTVEISADISINDRRHIPYNIEISKDGGKTYEFEPWVFDEIDDNNLRGGYKATFDASHDDMKQIIDISKTQDVIVRIASNPDNSGLGPSKGQYVKVHAFTIVADSVETGGGDVELSNNLIEQNQINIKNNIISATRGAISVHTISGKFVGAGPEVRVNKGLYIVTSGNLRKKIFIQ